MTKNLQDFETLIPYNRCRFTRWHRLSLYIFPSITEGVFTEDNIAFYDSLTDFSKWLQTKRVCKYVGSMVDSSKSP